MHFLVGFHDYDPWDIEGQRVLGLSVDFMNRAVVAGDQARVGLWDAARESFTPLASTNAWNFPQGARQQFVRSTGEILFNRQVGDAWRAIGLSLETGKEREFEGSVYAVAPDDAEFYGLNFARLHRLGGYGYVGLGDSSIAESAPADDGIFVTNLGDDKTCLLVSIADVAATSGQTPVLQGSAHYLTHVVPSPDGTRLAFLHRYWLADGGIQTRLMVCRRNGSDIECRAEGFLSHFDWFDTQRILIWGRRADSLQRARSSGLLANPLARSVLQLAKPIARRWLRKTTNRLSGNYLLVGETGTPVVALAPSQLTEDGHPSLRPGTRDVILTDTYPDPEGWRRLYLFELASETTRDLGRHRQAQIEPDGSRLAEAALGIDPAVMRAFSPKHFAYSRSGIHCDFHPRWRGDGRAVCFDSNHEGSRRIYTLELE